MWVFWVATLLTLSLAAALIAVVVIASGRLDNSKLAQSDKFGKFEQVADITNRHLNGQGTPPKMFERFEERYHERHNNPERVRS